MFQIIRSKFDLKNVIREIKNANSRIGLVPTMGALHQGHLKLVKLAVDNYDVTIVTIFVNPIQFNNKEDLNSYPKTEKADVELLQTIGCNYVFIPEANEIYKNEPILNLDFGYLEHILEGKYRLGHFNGVGLIVMKLFGLIEPDGAFFGQKDLQQFRVISALVTDFELPIKLHLVPIIREQSGLAMSSRNRNLSVSDLEIASTIYANLKWAKGQLNNGVAIDIVTEEVLHKFMLTEGIGVEYFEIVDAQTLRLKSKVNAGDRLALCAAATVAGIRLIDNLIIDL